MNEPVDAPISAEITPLPRNSLFAGRIPQFVLAMGRKGFWPLADQGVVSLGNFVTLVLVARGLALKSEYGIFGLILEVIFYLNTLQGSVIIYPLTVGGATTDDRRIRALTSAALLMTLAIAAPVALLMLGVATGLHGATLGLTAAAALVTWQIQEVVRSALRARFRFAQAAIGDAIRYLGTAACMFVLWRLDRITLPSVFLVITAGAALATLVQALQVGLERITRQDLQRLAGEFWTSGRWLLYSSASAILVSLCGVWTLSWFHGNAPVGEFYAVANFTKPLNPIVMTFAALVTQHAAKTLAERGMRAAKLVGLKLTYAVMALTMPYLMIVAVLPRWSMRIFYGSESHFLTPRGELALRLFCMGFALFITMSMIGSFLNGVGRTRDSFRAQVVNSVATVAIAFPLTIAHGLIGQIIGGAVAALVQLLSMIYFFKRAR